MGDPTEPVFRITAAERGYAVALPADFLAEFPPLFRARIALGTGEAGERHAFDATCEIAGKAMLVTPDGGGEPFPFAAADSRTFDIDAYGIDDPERTNAFWSTPIAEIRDGGRFRAGDRSRCRGCSRDPAMAPYHGDDSMCMCYSSVVPVEIDD